MNNFLFNLKFLHMTENSFPQALPVSVTNIRCFKTAQLCNIQMTLRSVKQIYSSPDMTVLNINCSSKSPCVPCYVVGKYDRPAEEKCNYKSLQRFHLMLVFPDPDFPISKTFFLFMMTLQ